MNLFFFACSYGGIDAYATFLCVSSCPDLNSKLGSACLARWSGARANDHSDSQWTVKSGCV